MNPTHIAESSSFIPKSASKAWPFSVQHGQYREPRWNSKLVLYYGVIENLLGLQDEKPREFWDKLPRSQIKTFMKSEGGLEHPSRKFVSDLIHEGESVLDAGCGVGSTYEIFSKLGKGYHYTGVDSSKTSIEVAREIYPATRFEVGSLFNLKEQFGEQAFDVTLERHVLEHLPDFEQAMNEIIAVSKRLAIFVFYLTPRKLPLGIRKINARLEAPFYTNIYSKEEIEKVLLKQGLYFKWFYDIGVSKAAWLSGETNSVLVVSRNPAQLR